MLFKSKCMKKFVHKCCGGEAHTTFISFSRISNDFWVRKRIVKCKKCGFVSEYNFPATLGGEPFDIGYVPKNFCFELPSFCKKVKYFFKNIIDKYL